MSRSGGGGGGERFCVRGKVQVSICNRQKSWSFLVAVSWSFLRSSDFLRQQYLVALFQEIMLKALLNTLIL